MFFPSKENKSDMFIRKIIVNRKKSNDDDADDDDDDDKITVNDA